MLGYARARFVCIASEQLPEDQAASIHLPAGSSVHQARLAASRPPRAQPLTSLPLHVSTVAQYKSTPHSSPILYVAQLVTKDVLVSHNAGGNRTYRVHMQAIGCREPGL